MIVGRLQLPRKRHIGNDIIVLIFQDEDADPFTPQKFASHFNRLFPFCSSSSLLFLFVRADNKERRSTDVMSQF